MCIIQHVVRDNNFFEIFMLCSMPLPCCCVEVGLVVLQEPPGENYDPTVDDFRFVTSEHIALPFLSEIFFRVLRLQNELRGIDVGEFCTVTVPPPSAPLVVVVKIVPRQQIAEDQRGHEDVVHIARLGGGKRGRTVQEILFEFH